MRSKETDQEKKGNRNGIQNIYKWTPFSKLRKNHEKFQGISEKKHKNLSDTNRNSRMKETDKELIRRREKGEAFVEEDVFFWVVEWKWKKKITADGVCFRFSIQSPFLLSLLTSLSVYFNANIKFLELCLPLNLKNICKRWMILMCWYWRYY